MAIMAEIKHATWCDRTDHQDDDELTGCWSPYVEPVPGVGTWLTTRRGVVVAHVVTPAGGIDLDVAGIDSMIAALQALRPAVEAAL